MLMPLARSSRYVDAVAFSGNSTRAAGVSAASKRGSRPPGTESNLDASPAGSEDAGRARSAVSTLRASDSSRDVGLP